jgi:hypothetical protein
LPYAIKTLNLCDLCIIYVSKSSDFASLKTYRAVNSMDDQTNQTIAIEKAEPSGGTIASDNFERWAKAVRQQMLECLQKRTRR